MITTGQPRNNLAEQLARFKAEKGDPSSNSSTPGIVSSEKRYVPVNGNEGIAVEYFAVPQMGRISIT